MKIKKQISFGMLLVITAATLFTLTSMTMDKNNVTAYLEITLEISAENREKAAGIYLEYKNPFLEEIQGALSKELLIRTEDVQVLHGFESEAAAKAYLNSELFSKDVVGGLAPLLTKDPNVRIYSVFSN